VITVTYKDEQEVPLIAIWESTQVDPTPPGVVAGNTVFIKVNNVWRRSIMMTKVNGVYQ
jgi:hypothetical protein